ncbi:MAG: SDR family NAD(P)-dependent oxidoreductase [Nitrospina sp.]|nr:SDR family NAD(P)-dependent oxidoreductase [Nitrospina sp.]
MNLKNKKILVTGADGFIGSHLVEELVRQGIEVRAFVFYNSFNSWGWLDESPEELKTKIDIFSGDIRDPHGVEQAMQGCNVVMHLASLIGIPYSYHSPDSYVDTNIKGTLNILQAARKLELEKIVCTSTSEVYGTARYVPIDEGHPLQGQSPYSATKIAADQIAMSFYCSFGSPVALIRPFNTYGPRQSLRAVIPTIITQLAKSKTTIKLGSLHPTRDFSFVKDIVNGFIAIAESDASIGEAINVGSGFEISIKELGETIGDLMGSKIKFNTEEIRLRPGKSEVERLLADNSKANQIINWVPKYAGKEGLKRGLKETIDWYSHPETLKKYRTDEFNF